MPCGDSAHAACPAGAADGVGVCVALGLNAATPVTATSTLQEAANWGLSQRTTSSNGSEGSPGRSGVTAAELSQEQGRRACQKGANEATLSSATWPPLTRLKSRWRMRPTLKSGGLAPLPAATPTAAYRTPVHCCDPVQRTAAPLPKATTWVSPRSMSMRRVEVPGRTSAGLEQTKAVGVAEGEWDVDAEGEASREGVEEVEGDADTVEEALGDAETVLDTLGDAESVGEGLGVTEIVGVTLLVALAEGVADGGMNDADADGDGEMEAVAVAVGVTVGVGVALGITAVRANSRLQNEPWAGLWHFTAKTMLVAPAGVLSDPDASLTQSCPCAETKGLRPAGEPVRASSAASALVRPSTHSLEPSGALTE
mmetsp:Transcript_5756/g.24281  ORF Transcript_5756/g.24281 Transcript_5756/m.24281 type:complete len:369 (-) Transcript_5756:782-1888(-)